MASPGVFFPPLLSVFSSPRSYLCGSASAPGQHSPIGWPGKVRAGRWVDYRNVIGLIRCIRKWPSQRNNSGLRPHEACPRECVALVVASEGRVAENKTNIRLLPKVE